MKTALVVALCIGFAGHANASCADDRVTVTGAWGHANFAVTVADDDAERSQGLMNVTDMAMMSGMLFVYPRPQRATFWMRNTLIGLDMIFAAPDGTVLSLHENAVPLDETVIDGGDGVQFVLELNSGMVARLGIKAGDILQHPAFGADAIAPCD
ncbi:MAG: uncharacterized membrane protein (UPF0127 family) [Yoonia sp.]|jgi:uncharacterized membrane protein (UPF0127 family)